MEDISLRHARLIIDKGKLTNNVKRFCDLLQGNTKLMAVVKANGYAHGAVETADAAQKGGAQWLGVATVGEGIELRRAGIEMPILVLGMVPPPHVPAAIEWDLTWAVSESGSLAAIQQCAKRANRCAHIHAKINTGMNRIGFYEREMWQTFLRERSEYDKVVLTGVFTHFADADQAHSGHTQRQAARFEQFLSDIPPEQREALTIHACNTAGMIGFPEYHYDMVRLGIGMYGYPPMVLDGIEPPLRWEADILFLHEVHAGESIGYNCTRTAECDMRIAVVPVGYADGYSRLLSNCGEVVIRGEKAPVVGRICMDQCMVDVSRIPQVQIGDRVILIGEEGGIRMDAGVMAEKTQTIPYEVLLSLSTRMPRIYRS